MDFHISLVEAEIEKRHYEIQSLEAQLVTLRQIQRVRRGLQQQ